MSHGAAELRYHCTPPGGVAELVLPCLVYGCCPADWFQFTVLQQRNPLQCDCHSGAFATLLRPHPGWSGCKFAFKRGHCCLPLWQGLQVSRLGLFVSATGRSDPAIAACLCKRRVNLTPLLPQPACIAMSAASVYLGVKVRMQVCMPDVGCCCEY
jgi:hypothetical protein